MTTEKILVVDDEPEIRNLIKEILVDEGFDVATAKNGATARNLMGLFRPHLTLLDIWMPDIDGISLLKEWKEAGGAVNPVIMMSGHGNVETAVEATRLGAYDYLEKPLSLAKLTLTIKNALAAAKLQKENLRLRQFSQPPATIVGKSEKMTGLRNQLRKIANLDAPVLIIGEPGTNKETVARCLHAESDRRDQPFVALSVSALAPEAAVAEIYGREEKGAIHAGFMGRAKGGALFIKDIADLDMAAQAQLHNALERRKYKRVNGAAPVEMNARIVAATCHPIAERVKQAAFLDDLYFQLNVLPITVPPLREHYEDVPEILQYYVNHFVERAGLPYRRFTTAAQNRLRRYAWPGNIRELKNLAQRLLILGNHPSIDLADVEAALGEQPAAQQVNQAENFDLPLREARENFEKAYLEHQLKQADGSVSKMARFVGMERTHLYRKLKSLGVNVKN